MECEAEQYINEERAAALSTVRTNITVWTHFLAATCRADEMATRGEQRAGRIDRNKADIAMRSERHTKRVDDHQMEGNVVVCFMQMFAEARINVHLLFGSSTPWTLAASFRRLQPSMIVR